MKRRDGIWRMDGGASVATPARAMRRGSLYRFRDRQSYKPSEVVGLFVLSLFGGMFVFGICMLVDSLIQRIFG